MKRQDSIRFYNFGTKKWVTHGLDKQNLLADPIKNLVETTVSATIFSEEAATLALSQASRMARAFVGAHAGAGRAFLDVALGGSGRGRPLGTRAETTTWRRAKGVVPTAAQIALVGSIRMHPYSQRPFAAPAFHTAEEEPNAQARAMYRATMAAVGERRVRRGDTIAAAVKRRRYEGGASSYSYDPDALGAGESWAMAQPKEARADEAKRYGAERKRRGLKDGREWLDLPKGYASIKEHTHPEARGRVNMTASGRMLADMDVRAKFLVAKGATSAHSSSNGVVSSSIQLHVGFASQRSLRIAMYHKYGTGGRFAMPRRDFAFITKVEGTTIGRFFAETVAGIMAGRRNAFEDSRKRVQGKRVVEGKVRSGFLPMPLA